MPRRPPATECGLAPRPRPGMRPRRPGGPRCPGPGLDPGLSRALMPWKGGSRPAENVVGSWPSLAPPSPRLGRRRPHFAEKQEKAIHTQELPRKGVGEKGPQGCVKKRGEEIGKADFSCSAAVTPGPPSPPARGPAEPRSLLRGSRAAPGGGIHTLAHTPRTQLI